MRDQENRTPGGRFEGGHLVSSEQVMKLALRIWPDQYTGDDIALSWPERVRKTFGCMAKNPGSA